ncbi:MAG: hypothetical protein M3358_13505 [Actinomycetota bacterium]|jgi:hypothetical protein|nr:hypothetical protein [Actinomycetota bacterium]
MSRQTSDGLRFALASQTCQWDWGQTWSGWNTTIDQTCGEGLAANAVLPAKLAELMAARAEVLKRHTRALDLTDAAAQKELDAYTSLERAHRDVASELADLAEEMASYCNLPMGRHDMTVMTDPKGQMEAFRRFVAVEQELLALLQATLEVEEKLLR